MAEAKKDKKETKKKVSKGKLIGTALAVGLVLLIWGAIRRHKSDPSALSSTGKSRYSEILTVTNGGEWVGIAVPRGWKLDDSVLTPGAVVDYRFNNDPNKVEIAPMGNVVFSDDIQYKEYRITAANGSPEAKILCQLRRK